MPRLCTEIIEDSLPRVADSEHVALAVAMGADLAQPQVAGLRAHREATRGRGTASPVAIAERPLTGALKGTGLTPATGDSPAANEPSVDANQVHRALVVSAAAAVGRRADSLRMEAAVRTVADTSAAGMPALDMPAADTAAADTAAAEVTVVADTAADAKRSGLVLTAPVQIESPALSRAGLSCSHWKAVAHSPCRGAQISSTALRRRASDRCYFTNMSPCGTADRKT